MTPKVKARVPMKPFRRGTPVMVKYRGKWSKGYVNDTPDVHGAQGEDYRIEIIRLEHCGPFRDVKPRFVRLYRPRTGKRRER